MPATATSVVSGEPLARGGRVFAVRRLEASDDALLAAAQRLLEETFAPELVDPLAYLRAGVEGRLPTGEPDCAVYRVFAAVDETGTPQSLYAGGVLALGGDTGECLFMGAYGVTRPESRRLGLVRALYHASRRQAVDDARARGGRLTLIAGETTAESELTWNRLGRKRAYVQLGPSRFAEVSYHQPALDFDRRTGKPTGGAASREHLMVQFLDEPPAPWRLASAVEAIHRWCYAWPAQWFDDAAAHRAHADHLADLRRDGNDLLRRGALTLLSADERQQLIAAGAQIVDGLLL